MQHGTGREVVTEAIENAVAVLESGHILGEVLGLDARARRALERALEVLNGTENLDEPGVYGPDYGAEAPYDWTDAHKAVEEYERGI